MYIPKDFEITDLAALHDFIGANSFATLVSSVDGSPYATHLPLLLDSGQSEHGTLQGHVAAANPHWRQFDGSNQTLAIFHGPHSYVSPDWYKTKPAVPTWNYAVVHVYGHPEVRDDSVWLASFLDRLTLNFDAGFAEASKLSEEFAELKANALRGIVGFEMEIARIEGKFKMAQNRSDEDQASVASRLDEGESFEGRRLADLMRANQEHSSRK